MKILVVEPGCVPYEKDIPSTLEAMQAVVGGTVQAIYPFPEPVALICSDEGKLLGLHLNRALRNDDGSIYDVVAGTFFLCGAPVNEESFTSLTDKEIQKFRAQFSNVEIFFRTGSGLLVLRAEQEELI